MKTGPDGEKLTRPASDTAIRTSIATNNDTSADPVNIRRSFEQNKTHHHISEASPGGDAGARGGTANAAHARKGSEDLLGTRSRKIGGASWPRRSKSARGLFSRAGSSVGTVGAKAAETASGGGGGGGQGSSNARESDYKKNMQSMAGRTRKPGGQGSDTTARAQRTNSERCTRRVVGSMFL